ncbi:hypothetical protein R8Z50_14875 [Longispora sp. K20-0274]|uniref:hypothetical protein n=1 Tax=Longispora sp. K20-0274 TaxID=3088255 RepID=UPI00399BAB75
MSTGTRRRMLAATTGLLALGWTLTACELPVQSPAPSDSQSGSAAPEATGKGAANTSTGPSAKPSSGATAAPVGDFCKLYEADQEKMRTIILTANPSVVGVEKAKAKKAFQAVLDAAPADIRQDMTLIVTLDLDLIDGKPGAEARAESKETEAALSHTAFWYAHNC